MYYGDDGGTTVANKSAQNSDNIIQTIKKVLESGPYEDYVLKDGILYKVSDGCELY